MTTFTANAAVEEFKAEFATVDEAAQITRLSKTTLCRMRIRRSPESPPWFRVGGRVLYPLSQLREWADTRIAATLGGAQ